MKPAFFITNGCYTLMVGGRILKPNTMHELSIKEYVRRQPVRTLNNGNPVFEIAHITIPFGIS